MISAASGMKARMESLDMLANNLANAQTAGFKSDQEFYGLFEDELPVIEKQWTDFSQGLLTGTGNPLDLALSGDGFFAVTAPNGVLYTRNGAFEISKTNRLQTRDGYMLRNVLDDGKPIEVDASQSVDIDENGVVSQGGQPIGQIEIVTPANSRTRGMGKLGNSYFALSNLADAGPTASDTENQPYVRQGFLEQANVPVAGSAVRLVSVMRQFEMLQKALAVGADMNKAVNTIASTTA